jgi:tetratricopeptide (TPR) repeat protein
MEIQYGVLRNSKMDDRAFFYFKNFEDDIVEDVSSKHKLEALKQKITTDGRYPVGQYNSVEDLGAKIISDLWQQIDADFPEVDTPDAHEREKFDFAGFMNSHPLFGPQNCGIYKAVELSLITQGKTLITGECGTGKSALLSYFISRNQEGQILVCHFCGITPNSTQLEGLVNYIATELKRHISIPLNIPKKIEDPGGLLAAFIEAIPAEKSVLLVIDGLDRLTDAIERRLNWLPEIFPSNIKLLLSTSSEEQKQILKKRIFSVFELPPLEVETIKELTVSYLNIYSKKLSENLLNEIGEFQQAANPLILFTLLNELRLFGRHEELQSHLSRYISTTSKAQFFDALLGRFEQDYPGEDFNLTGVLSSLLFSVKGLTETEILQINQISALRWSQLHNALDYHLLNKGGKISISNPYLKNAIQKRYIDKDGGFTQHVEPLISHFYAGFDAYKSEWDSPELARVLEELPHLAMQADNKELLLEIITNMPALILLDRNDNLNIPRYFSYLRNSYTLSQELKVSMDEFAGSGQDDQNIIKAAFVSGVLVSAHISGAEAVPFFYSGLEVYSRNPQTNFYIFESLKELASIFTQLGYINDAAEILLNLLPFGNKDDISEIFNLLPEYFRNAGKSKVSEILLQDTVDYSALRYGEQNINTAMQYNTLARHYDVIKNFELAGKYYQMALQIVETQYGTRHPLYLVIQSNVGILSLSNANPEAASRIFEEVLKLRLEILGENHRSTLKTINSLGVAKSLTGAFEEANLLLNRALDGQNKLLGPYHKETLITLSNLADAYERMGDKEKSIELLYDIVDKMILQYGEYHENTINAAMGLATALADAGKTTEAIVGYQRLLKMQKHFYGENHQMVGLTSYKYAQLRLSSGEWDNEDLNACISWKMYLASNSRERNDLAETSKHYTEVVDVIDRFANGSHPAIFDAMENLAGLNHHLMEYQEAAKWSGRIADVAKQVYGENHPAYLEFRVLQAFNLFSDGDRDTAFRMLRELGDHYDALMDFPKKHVSSMFREILGYFTAFGEAAERYNQNQDEVRQLYENAQKYMDQAIGRFNDDAFPEAMHWIDKAIENADTLNKKYAEPFITVFNHKASMQEQMELYTEAVDTAKAGIEHLQYWNAVFDARSFFLNKLAGDAFMMLEKREEALTFYKMALKVNQHEQDYPNANTVECNASLISYYVDIEDFEKAFNLIDQTYPLALEKLGPDNSITKWLLDLKEQSSQTE